MWARNLTNLFYKNLQFNIVKKTCSAVKSIAADIVFVSASWNNVRQPRIVHRFTQKTVHRLHKFTQKRYQLKRLTQIKMPSAFISNMANAEGIPSVLICIVVLSKNICVNLCRHCGFDPQLWTILSGRSTKNQYKINYRQNGIESDCFSHNGARSSRAFLFFVHRLTQKKCANMPMC